jgi:Ca2+-binding EF-hand superfamily protein
LKNIKISIKNIISNKKENLFSIIYELIKPYKPIIIYKKREKMPNEAEIEEIVKKAFEIYDTDKSGFLERDEIKKLLDDACGELGADEITESQLDAVIQTVDANNDGKFSFDELNQIIGPILRQNNE